MDEELIQFDVEEVEIEVEEGTGWNGGDGTRHSDMPDKYEPNQHIIESITGLREELDNIEALKTVESDGYGTANYYKWGDGAHNEFGHFVSLVPETDKIVVCTGQGIFGVTVERAGFTGGQDEAMARDNTYGLVQTFDRVDVRCESDVSVGDSVVSNSYGVAMKTDSECGYKVIAVNNIQGVAYATIALGVQACTTDALGKMIESLDTRLTSDIESLDTRLTSAESDIAAASPKLATIDIDHACITGGAKTDIGKPTFYGFYIGQNGLEVGGYYDKSISGYHNLTYTAATGELAVETLLVSKSLRTNSITADTADYITVNDAMNVPIISSDTMFASSIQALDGDIANILFDKNGMLCSISSNESLYAGMTSVEMGPDMLTLNSKKSLVAEGDYSAVRFFVGGSIDANDDSSTLSTADTTFAVLDDGSLYTAAIKVKNDITADGYIQASYMASMDGTTTTMVSPGSVLLGNGATNSAFRRLEFDYEDATYYYGFDPTVSTSWLNIINAGLNWENSGSDSRIKHSIEMLPESYEVLFDSLTARRYKYNDGTSDRYHTGYVAQEVVSAIEKAGLSTKDFAAVVLENPDTDQECWYLRRDEFVALNTWQIQKLKARVVELEKIVAKLQEA